MHNRFSLTMDNCCTGGPIFRSHITAVTGPPIFNMPTLTILASPKMARGAREKEFSSKRKKTKRESPRGYDLRVQGNVAIA